MRQAQAKATRRDLRRAMGDQAIGVIDEHDAVLKAQALALQSEALERTKLEQRLLRTSATCDHLLEMNERNSLNIVRLQYVFGGSFWLRLRWLLRGGRID